MSHESDIIVVEIPHTLNKMEEGAVFVDMYELWGRLGYKIPYARWLNYSRHNYGITGQPYHFRQLHKGRPVTHFFVKVEDARDFINALVRRNRKQIKINGEIYNGEISVEENNGEDDRFFRPTRPKERGLRLVRD